MILAKMEAYTGGNVCAKRLPVTLVHVHGTGLRIRMTIAMTIRHAAI
jgi:hypothetical protein